MGEIGSTLQQARMRAGLDIAEIETATKIRAKYLRALEQEDWAQLPGPTYVRSFLRTYADALGLDGRMMVEQYRLRHERPSDQDLMPISPPRRASNGGGGYRPPRGAVLAGLVVVLIGALWWLGSGRDEKKSGSSATTTATDRPATSAGQQTGSTPSRVRLQVRARDTVVVCIQDATGKLVVDGKTLDKGDRTATLRSEAFRVRLGNGDAVLVVNGKVRRVGTGSPQAWRVSPKSVRRIGIDRSPSCQPG